MTEISKATKSELNKIKQELDEPYLERGNPTIIENIGKIGGKEFTQYKLSIPKKLAENLGLTKKDFNAEAVLDKKAETLTITISKK